MLFDTHNGVTKDSTFKLVQFLKRIIGLHKNSVRGLRMVRVMKELNNL